MLHWSKPLPTPQHTVFCHCDLDFQTPSTSEILNHGLSLPIVILPGLLCTITMKETANNENNETSKVSNRKTSPVGRMCKSSRGFQQGHPYFESTHDETTETQHSSVWMPRLDREDFSRVVQETSGGLLTVPDADGISGGSKILRPRPNRGLTLIESYLQPDENQGLSSRANTVCVLRTVLTI